MTLKLNGTNSEAAPAYAGDDADTGLQCGTNELKLVTGGTARQTVDSAGRVILGADTAPTVASQQFRFNISGENFADSGQAQVRYESATAGPSRLFVKARGTAASPSIVQQGDQLGKMRFYGYDGSDFTSIGAEIEAEVDGTPGSDDMPGRLVFSTTADGASSPTERLRITSDGTIRLSANCPGIDFSQTQTNASGMTSETLDSFEKGTWTPSITFNSGNTGMVTTLQDGHYIKIGNFVSCNLVLAFSSKGTSTGTARLEGLPFAVGDNLSGTIHEAGGMFIYAANIAGSIEPPYTISPENDQTRCNLFCAVGNELTTNLSDSNFHNNTSLRAFFSYFTS